MLSRSLSIFITLLAISLLLFGVGCEHLSPLVIGQPMNPLVGTWETYTINGLTTRQAVAEFGGSFGATDLTAIWQFNANSTWETTVSVNWLGGELKFKHSGSYSYSGTGITLVAESMDDDVFLSDVFETLAGTWSRQGELLTLNLTDRYGRQFTFGLRPYQSAFTPAPTWQ